MKAEKGTRTFGQCGITENLPPRLESLAQTTFFSEFLILLYFKYSLKDQKKH